MSPSCLKSSGINSRKSKILVPEKWLTEPMQTLLFLTMFLYKHTETPDDIQQNLFKILKGTAKLIRSRYQK
jgi:hypothetical protein